MNTIKVEVTEAQHRYINALSGQIGFTAGELLLSLAFIELSAEVESRIDGLVSARREFVQLRQLPLLEEDNLFAFDIGSRPPTSRRSRKLATAEAIPATA